MTKPGDGTHQSIKARFSPNFKHSKESVRDSQLGQPIRVESLSSDEFSVILERSNNLRFVLFLSDDYYKNLTLLKIEKKKRQISQALTTSKDSYERTINTLV